jgi:glycosyltransferase involved in cell wall biosynthesis
LDESVLVSIIIPAFQAQATLTRAARSALDQTWQQLEVVIVSDDLFDYAEMLHRAGIDDARLRFVSTGRAGSGCHNARNVGLSAARGDFVAALDADDFFYSDRIATLLPIAGSQGAASDNPRVVADTNNAELYRAFDAVTPEHLDIPGLLALSVPLFPLVAREYAEPRLPGIELAEDVVANLRLIDRLGSLPIFGGTLSEYRVVTGSLCHNDKSADGFDEAYGNLITRLKSGDRLGLSPGNAQRALEGLTHKRDFNRAFGRARALDRNLDFQTFAAGQR